MEQQYKTPMERYRSTMMVYANTSATLAPPYAYPYSNANSIVEQQLLRLKHPVWPANDPGDDTLINDVVDKYS